MVLCAGFGTRLSPLTDELAKPLVPLGDRPILAHVAAALAGQGVRKLVLNVHHRFSDFASVAKHLPLETLGVHEPKILGTAGGIAGARQLFESHPVIVHNADILVTPPVQRLLEVVGGGLCLAVSPRQVGQGSLGLGERGQVVRLRGRIFGHEASGADYVGVCAVGPECSTSLPAQGCLIGDWAIPELESGGEVRTVAISGSWTDVGSLPAYHGANLDWLRARGQQAFVAAGAQVSRAVSLQGTIVGARARVEGSGPLVDCVVWPGAHVSGPLQRHVVLESGRRVLVPG
jgi:mannose-1-phosphate guanylyltransferase